MIYHLHWDDAFSISPLESHERQRVLSLSFVPYLTTPQRLMRHLAIAQLASAAVAQFRLGTPRAELADEMLATLEVHCATPACDAGPPLLQRAPANELPDSFGSPRCSATPNQSCAARWSSPLPRALLRPAGALGDTTCVLEGALYDRPALARTMAVDADDDAHLVARAHRRLGLEALSQLRGRYAVVLWDDVRQERLIASDLLATRELFMSRTAGALVFATELDDVLALLPHDRRPTRSVSRRGWTMAPALRTGPCTPASRVWNPANSWPSPGGPCSDAATGGPSRAR